MSGLRSLLLFFAVVVAFGFCLSSAASAQTTYTITDLPLLGDPRGINSSGQITGFGLGPDAFLYSQGTITDLGTLGGSFSFGLGINDSGEITGGSPPTGDFPPHAFLYSNGHMTDLGTLGGSFISSVGEGINNSGQITGFSDTADDTLLLAAHAFLYSGGTMTDLGTLGGNFSVGFGINGSGQVTGESATTTGDFPPKRAFLYSGGKMIDLGDIGGGVSQGFAINSLGQVTGDSLTAAGNFHAFLYSAGQIMDLGTLGGSESVGVGINASGQVVGSAQAADGHFAPFLYTVNAGMVDLNTLIPSGSGWTIFFPRAINDAGQITGIGSNPDGLNHAFLLTPVTVPFSTFDAKMGLTGKPPTKFRLKGSFTLGAGSTGIDPVNQPVTLKLGTFSVSIPTGSFTTTSKGDYDFEGTVGGVAILFRITSVTSTSFTWEAKGATNSGLPATNPVSVGLTIGNNTGTVSVTAHGQPK
jgi:probable HAF family extracellular repeat protein